MIYIHIGLPKTGTTFLQNEIFPKWVNVTYLGQYNSFCIRPALLKDVTTIDPNSKKKYLVSDENLSKFSLTDNEKELVIYNLSRLFPDAKIIVSFRKHHSLITSIYKQRLHNGAVIHKLSDFFDIENNESILKKEDINYKKTIELIERYFNQKPFVYLQEELFDNFDGFFKDMEYFIGERAPNIEELNIKQSNKGIGYYQSIGLLKVNKLFQSPRNPDGIVPYNLFTRFTKEVLKYMLQSPLSILSKKPIKMDDKQKKLTLEYYKDDWNYVLNYIKNECSYRSNFNDLNYRYS